MNALPVLLAWSGGKDCLLALQRLLDDPCWRVVGLLTTINRSYQRVAMQGVRQTVLAAQTAALCQPLALSRGESVLRDSRFQFTDFLLADA